VAKTLKVMAILWSAETFRAWTLGKACDMRSSIRTRLTAAFIGLAIGSVLLVGVVLAWQSFTTQRQQALNSQARGGAACFHPGKGLF